MGCSTPSTGEDDHFIFTQKISSHDCLFVYSAGDNNIFGLIQPTQDSVDTSEAYMIDNYVVDTMGDDMLEAMEPKNGKIFNDSYYSCGEGK